VLLAIALVYASVWTVARELDEPPKLRTAIVQVAAGEVRGIYVASDSTDTYIGRKPTLVATPARQIKRVVIGPLPQRRSAPRSLIERLL
jgi:hypothetical protein